MYLNRKITSNIYHWTFDKTKAKKFRNLETALNQLSKMTIFRNYDKFKIIQL